MDFTHGMMADIIKETMSMIKKRAMENINGPMVGNIQATGKMANSMELEIIYLKMENQRKADGKMVKGWNGQIKWKTLVNEYFYKNNISKI